MDAASVVSQTFYTSLTAPDCRACQLQSQLLDFIGPAAQANSSVTRSANPKKPQAYCTPWAESSSRYAVSTLP